MMTSEFAELYKNDVLIRQAEAWCRLPTQESNHDDKMWTHNRARRSPSKSICGVELLPELESNHDDKLWTHNRARRSPSKSICGVEPLPELESNHDDKMWTRNRARLSSSKSSLAQTQEQERAATCRRTSWKSLLQNSEADYSDQSTRSSCSSSDASEHEDFSPERIKVDDEVDLPGPLRSVSVSNIAKSDSCFIARSSVGSPSRTSESPTQSSPTLMRQSCTKF